MEAPDLRIIVASRAICTHPCYPEISLIIYVLDLGRSQRKVDIQGCMMELPMHDNDEQQYIKRIAYDQNLLRFDPKRSKAIFVLYCKSVDSKRRGRYFRRVSNRSVNRMFWRLTIILTFWAKQWSVQLQRRIDKYRTFQMTSQQIGPTICDESLVLGVSSDLPN